MPPTLRLCLCFFLLTTCLARPNWHHPGVVIVKNVGLPLRAPPLAPPEDLQEAQLAAAQAIQDAGENAQLHLAILKKKYMDIVRQRFYNHIASVPHLKERPHNFEPTRYAEDVLPVNNVPHQPLITHHPAENNPCSGNILICLLAKIPSRLGKVNPPSSGLQPCFGPNCNHVIFDPHFKPVVIPKPSHTGYSGNRELPKHPYKHHIICDGKQPNQNCHYRSTFWPTYSTLKLNSKLHSLTSTVSPKNNDHTVDLSTLQTPTEDQLIKKPQQHLILPDKFFDTAIKPSPLHSEIDEKSDIETLRTINASKLENEILGISEMSKDGIKSATKPTTVSQISSQAINKVIMDMTTPAPTELYFNTDTSKNTNQVIQITTENSPDFKKNSQSVPPLKTSTTLSQQTSKYSFHTNDIIETFTNQIPKTTELPLTSLEEKKISMTSGFNKEYSTTEDAHYSVNKKLELETTTFDQNFEWKSELGLMNTGNPVSEASPTTMHYKEEVLLTSANIVPTRNQEIDQQTTAAKEYFSGETTPINSLFKTVRVDNDQVLYTTTHEHNSRLFDSESIETTTYGSRVPPIDNVLEQREFPIQTIFKTVADLTESTPEFFNYLGRDDSPGDPAIGKTTGLSSIGTQKTVEDLYTPITVLSSPKNNILFEATAVEPVSGFSTKMGDSLFFTTDSLINSDQNEVTKDNKEFREETYSDFSKTSSNSTTMKNTESENVETIKFLTTQLPDTEGSRVVVITTEDSTERIELDSDIETQNKNDVEAPFVATENILETLTNQELPSKLNRSDSTTVEGTTAQSYFNYIQGDPEGKKSEINWEDENNQFESMMEVLAERPTEETDTTEYSSLAREELDQDYDNTIFSLGNMFLHQIPAIGDESSFSKLSVLNSNGVHGEILTSIAEATRDRNDTTTLFNGIEDNLTHSPPLSENNQISSTLNRSTDILILAEENDSPGTSTHHISMDYQDITTEEGLNGRPQLKEGDEEFLTTPASLESSTEILSNGEKEETTFATTFENEHERSSQNSTYTDATEVPQLREDLHEDPTVSFTVAVTKANIKFTPTGSEPNTQTVHSILTRKEEKPLEPKRIFPVEMYDKTDSPGLLLNEYWTEEQTENTLNNLPTQFIASVGSSSTENPQSKVESKEDISEVPHFSETEIADEDVTEDTGLINLKHDESLQLATLVRSNQIPPTENTKETTSPLNINQLLDSYQDGILKFTTEIETITKHAANTGESEGSTDSGLLLLNDGLNRKVRSVHHNKEGGTSYPTTECVLCLLGLPHNHRLKRSSEDDKSKNATNNQKPDIETDLLQNRGSRDSNCSSNTSNQSLEYPEDSRFYASAILELLPVIKEGYRNNAFNEDDKNVMRSLFGDMKSLIDEKMLEEISESTGELLMGDGASRIDEIVDETYYDSSESNVDTVSEEEIRLKRSKKHLQIMNDLLKKITTNLKTQSNIAFQLKNSRMVRSTQVSQAEASAILALLAEKGEAVQLDIPDDDDDDEYEYYEDEGDDYREDEEDSEYDNFEDDYDDNPSFVELIKLARKHRERKAREEKQ